MALSTYSELAETIGRYLDRTDRSDEIQDWVRLVELEVGRKLNLRSQQLSTTGTLTSGSSSLETPAGILYPQLLKFAGSPPIIVNIAALADGEETAFEAAGRATPLQASLWGVNPATFGTLVRVWPPPAGDVDYTLYYTTGITALTTAAPTNYLLLVAADLYLYGSLYHAQMFDENPEGAAIWRPLFDEQIRTVKRMEALARAKGGRLRMRSQYATQ